MRFSKLKMLGKGALAAVLTQAILHLQAADPAEILADPKAWGLTLGVAVLRSLLNAAKNRDMADNPLNGKSRRGPYYRVLLVCLAPLLALGGCVTTQHPDGSVEQRVDVELLREAYQYYLMEVERLEAEDAREDAAEEAERQRLLAQARQMAEALERRLEERGYL